MLELQQLRLRDFLLFKEQDFTFQPGLTVIQGDNYSGKSLLLSALDGLLFNLASGERFPRGCSVELDLRKITPDTKTNLRIGARSPGVKPDWELFVNKQDMATHRKKDVRRLIDRYIPITEDLFKSTSKITAGDNVPLTYGTPAVKLDWLSSAFNLAVTYNQMGENIADKLSSLQKDEVRLDVLQGQLISVPESVDNRLLRKLQSQYDTLSDRMKQWSKFNQQREELKTLRLLVAALNKRRTEYKTEDDLLEAKQSIQKRLKDHERNRKAATQYDAAILEFKRSVSNRKELINKLPKAFQPENPREAKVLLKGCAKALQELNDFIEEAEAKNEQFHKAVACKTMLKQYKKPRYDKAKAELILYKARNEIVFINGILAKINKNNDNICPECGTELTKNHVHKVETNYQERQRKAIQRQDESQNAINYYELVEQLKDAPTKLTDIDSLKAEKTDVKRIIGQLERLLDLPRVTKPVRPTSLKKVDEKKLRKKLTAIQSDLALLQAHGRTTFPNLKSSEERIVELEQILRDSEDEKVDLLSEKTIQLNEKLQKLKAQQSRYNDAIKNNARLQDEISELKKRVWRLRPLRALKEAFGRSGIMLDAMNDGIQHLLQELNALVPLLINEQFRIDIVTGPRKLDVLIERNGVVGSVKTLSKSEQRCWQLLFATAMIRILPNNMLMDTIILDELESNMNEKNRRRYTMEFLPYLQTLVPKVIVISPLISNELQMRPDRVFRVEKKNRVSTLRAL